MPAVVWIALVLLLALPASVRSAEPVVLRVCYEDKDTPDHTGTGQQVPMDPGILVELIKMIETKVPDLRINFLRRPWWRCLLELEEGKVDSVFSSSFKPERLKIGVYPMKDGKADRTYRIDTKSYSLFVLRTAPIEWDGSVIRNVRQEVAAMQGYAIVSHLKSMGIAVREVLNSQTGFRMLVAGRVDAFAQLTEVGDFTLKKHPELSAVVKLSPPLTTLDYYLQVGHPFQARHPELTLRIWKALADLRRTDLERLSLKYMRLFDESEADAAPR